MALILLLFRKFCCITLTLHIAQWMEDVMYIYIMLTLPPSHAQLHV